MDWFALLAVQGTLKSLLQHHNLKSSILQHSAFFMVQLSRLFSLLEKPPGASLLAQLVKNAPAMQETQVRSLGWEDPLEKGKATHSSSLIWKISWTEEPGGLPSMGSQRAGRD